MDSETAVATENETATQVIPNESTAVTAPASSTPPVDVATDAEINEFRKNGAAMLAKRKETNALFKALEGMTWESGGSKLHGSDLSPTVRALIAEFAYLTRANIFLHIDILGGKPYLNAQYWMERMQSDIRHMSHELINISDNAAKRAEYGVPAWAKFAYEIVITKLVPFAPIEKIQSGEILDFERYKTVVRECNWAGGKGNDNGKKDPVGDAEPAKTARTRALRRGARVAYSAWMEQYDEQIKKVETAIEAQYEIIKTEPLNGGAKRQLQPGEPQTVRAGAGEPTAAEPTGRDLGTSAPVPNATDAPAPVSPEEQDRRDKALRGFFATLRAYNEVAVPAMPALLPISDRREWQQSNGLPESATDFTAADAQRATELLTKPVRDTVLDGLGILGFDSINEYCSRSNLPVPEKLGDLVALLIRVRDEVDGNV